MTIFPNMPQCFFFLLSLFDANVSVRLLSIYIHYYIWLYILKNFLNCTNLNKGELRLSNSLIIKLIPQTPAGPDKSEPAHV